ncbi:MAG: 3'-5' exonuclease [Bacteroidetes bacterium]|nr:3'-5' exonuclease [Bacteroidota bacterium]
MQLILDRPLAIFDLETTGINITQDRIVEIAILKIHPDNSEEKYMKRVNPQIKMSEENMAIHGITNEDVADAPTFDQIADEVEQFIDGCDLGGFNSNKFDVPVLVEEMLRVKDTFSLENRRFVDVQNIFHKMEQRTLSAAYKFYCSKDLINAHSAMADAQATWDVLKAQVNHYTELENNMDFLSSFSTAHDMKRVDFAGRLAMNDDGEVVYNFGKHRGKTVAEIHKVESGYYGWLLNADFPLHTKQCLKKEMDRLKALKNIKKDKEVNIEDKLFQLKKKFNS